MRRFQIIIFRGVSWTFVLAFIAGAAWYGFSMQQLFAALRQPHSGYFMMCGNSVTDPLCLLLNYGVPLAAVGVIGMAIDVNRYQGRRWPMWMCSILTICVAIALIIFGVRFFRDSLGSSVGPLSSQIWWM